jgi:hypothetical protein
VIQPSAGYDVCGHFFWEAIMPDKIDVPTGKRSRHHRKPQSMGGGDEPANISNVRDEDHRAYHRLFGPGSPWVVARILNDIWVDPEYELVVHKRQKRRSRLRNPRKRRTK